MNILIEMIAKNPPSLLIAFGGVGWIVGISGYIWFLLLGVLLQVLWITKG